MNDSARRRQIILVWRCLISGDSMDDTLFLYALFSL